MIDLGCGTGATSIYAAKSFKKVYGIDVSEMMIKQAKKKSDIEGIKNIEFINTGFLTYTHKDEPADLVITKAAFHHLPDFWKQRALQRVAGMLRPGGKFFLFDIVFPAAAADLDAQIGQWLAGIGRMANARLAGEALVHVRDEHSTYDWVMEGMLARAGFTLAAKEYAPGFQTTYLGII